MANEISISVKLRATKGDLTENKQISFTDDMAGAHKFSKVFDIGVSEVPLTIPSEIVIPGWILIRNTSDNEHIELSTGTGGTFAAHCVAILYPGDVYFTRSSSVTLRAQNESVYGVTGQLEVTVIEL